MTMKIDRMSNCERDRRVSGSRYILTCKECWSEFECEHKVALTVSVQFKVAAVLLSTWNATSTFNYAPTLESFQSKTNVTPESTSTSAATEREVERLRKKLFFCVCKKGFLGSPFSLCCVLCGWKKFAEFMLTFIHNRVRAMHRVLLTLDSLRGFFYDILLVL